MNIRQRILASGAIGIVAVVLLGGVGFWGQLRLGKALSENELSVNALRNHMEGDMMHDALRADVLAAFVVQPGDGAAAEQVREDLQEHSQWFRKVVEQNQGLPLNDAIHQALVELRPDLEAYIGAAESIVGKALLDPVAARAELPQFVQAFKELEGRNEAAQQPDRETRRADQPGARRQHALFRLDARGRHPGRLPGPWTALSPVAARRPAAAAQTGLIGPGDRPGQPAGADRRRQQ